MQDYMTAFMEVNKIVNPILPAVFYCNSMVGVQFLSINDMFLAYWAFPILVFGYLAVG